MWWKSILIFCVIWRIFNCTSASLTELVTINVRDVNDFNRMCREGRDLSKSAQLSQIGLKASLLKCADKICELESLFQRCGIWHQNPAWVDPHNGWTGGPMSSWLGTCNRYLAYEINGLRIHPAMNWSSACIFPELASSPNPVFEYASTGGELEVNWNTTKVWKDFLLKYCSRIKII